MKKGKPVKKHVKQHDGEAEFWKHDAARHNHYGELAKKMGFVVKTRRPKKK